MPGHAQYGRWDFLRNTGRGDDSSKLIKVHTIYLFICILGKNSALVQLTTNCLTSFCHSTQILCTRNPRSLHSRTINLCFRWPHYEQPCLHSSLTWMTASNSHGQNENFFYWFIFSLGLKICLWWAVGFHCMLNCEYFMFPTPFRDQLNKTFISLCWLLTGFLTRRSLEEILPPFH
jgi:hypothetical protein